MSERTIRLHRLAHARTGDKGNRANIALFAYRPETYAFLAQSVTPDFVSQVFATRAPSRVRRFELPRLFAFNFVLDDVLDGGVNASLGLDGHGKGLSYMLLAAHVPVGAEWVERLGLDAIGEGEGG